MTDRLWKGLNLVKLTISGMRGFFGARIAICIRVPNSVSIFNSDHLFSTTGTRAAFGRLPSSSIQSPVSPMLSRASIGRVGTHSEIGFPTSTFTTSIRDSQIISSMSANRSQSMLKVRLPKSSYPL